MLTADQLRGNAVDELETGTAADRAKRPPVFSTPDSNDAMVMQAR